MCVCVCTHPECITTNKVPVHNELYLLSIEVHKGSHLLYVCDVSKFGSVCVCVCLRGGGVRVHSCAQLPDFSMRLFIAGLSGCLFSAQFHREERCEPFISPAPLCTVPDTVSSV